MVKFVKKKKVILGWVIVNMDTMSKATLKKKAFNVGLPYSFRA